MSRVVAESVMRRGSFTGSDIKAEYKQCPCSFVVSHSKFDLVNSNGACNLNVCDAEI